MSTMTREEWTTKYAARIAERSGMTAEEANDVAIVAASENFRDNGDEWLDPEDDADVEMSYWSNDE